MNPEEYAAKQAVISAAVAQFVLMLSKFFRAPALSPKDWVGFLNLLYPEIERRRYESAELAREFYDYQREIHHPELPRNDRPLEGNDFQEFVRSMEPARKKMSQEASSQDAVTITTLRAVRAVENAGRQQIIRAVKNDEDLAVLVEQEHPQAERVSSTPRDEILEELEDQQPRLIRGWARVATGRETCAWCLMLISRGAVYYSAESSGLDLDDESAAAMIASGEDVSEYMEEWHTGCDCKVVPVFKLNDWTGDAEHRRALRLWIEAGKEASALIKSGKARSDNINRETQNALRRALERGDIDPSQWAALAAA